MPARGRVVCDCPVLPLPELTQELVPVRRVALAAPTVLEDGVLSIDPRLADAAHDPLVVGIQLDVIAPTERNVRTDTILDVLPLAAKRQGGLGGGVTRVAQGVVVILTGRDEDGEQLGEAGNSAGILAERIAADAAGTPDPDDWIIRLAITLRSRVGMERRGPWAAHRAADQVIQPIRLALRDADPACVAETRTHEEPHRPGFSRVVLVKEVMGQGAMHDNLILPREPGGVAGGRSIIDLGNLPLVLRANELRDGAIHSMCCVGPSCKETTLHYFRDPLVLQLADDPEVDFRGVVVVGSPGVESDKAFIATRVGALVHALGADGAIVQTEGWGNNHIDFARHIAEIMKYGIPAVGATYASREGALVTGNEYMVAMIELNGSQRGEETSVLAESTARPRDARRAVAMLKTIMAGIDVLPAPRAWDWAAIHANQRMVDDAAAVNRAVPTVTPGIRSEIPIPAIVPAQLARLRVPLSQARIALITGAGVYVRGDVPFDRAGDESFREVPTDTPTDRLEFGAGSYDHGDVNRDPNCMFPLDRLRELVAAGEVGGLTAMHFGVQGGGSDTEILRTETAPRVVERLRSLAADGVILTGG